MKALQTNYGSLDLRSPIILGSSGITKAYENIEKADRYGAGAVVLKTKFQEPLMAHSPTPRFTIIHRGSKDYASTTNLSYEQGYEFSIDNYCEEIRRCKRDFAIKIIASIGCSTIDYWREWAKKVEQAGADAIEMNLSCPHSDYVMGRLGQINQMVKQAMPAVRQAVSIPVFSKMTPQLENPLITAKVMEESGSCGVVAFSRCLGLDLDIDSQTPILHGGYGGHGGPWSIHYALRWISSMYPHLHIPVSGCGGVVEWQDIVKYILCGATTVQVCFLVYTYGYGVIDQLNQGLARYMDKHGYASIEDFRGNIVPKIKGLTQVDREKTLVAKVEEPACIGCKRCTDICIYDGIDFTGKKALINEKCDGCGLCPFFCPKGAIHMVHK
ncbi:MAG: tRNA-dihydrouridine synthase [Clostridiales bacterium]